MSNARWRERLPSGHLALCVLLLPAAAQAETVVEWAPRTPVAILVQNVSRETPGISLSQLIEIVATRWASIAHVEPRVIESAEVSKCGAAVECRVHTAAAGGAAWLLLAYVSAGDDETTVRLKLIDVAAARGRDDEAVGRVATASAAGGSVVLRRGDEVGGWTEAVDDRLRRWVDAHPALGATASLVVVAPAAGTLTLGPAGPPVVIKKAGEVRIVGLPRGRLVVRGEAGGLETWEATVDVEAEERRLVWPMVLSAERRHDRMLFMGGVGLSGAVAISAWTAAAISAASATPRTCVGPVAASCAQPESAWTAVAVGATATTLGILTAAVVRGEPEIGGWEVGGAVAVGATTGVVLGVLW